MYSIIISIFAKACFAQCFTSRAALGPPGSSFSQSSLCPKYVPYKTFQCYILENPRVPGLQNRYSQLSNTLIQNHKCVPDIPSILDLQLPVRPSPFVTCIIDDRYKPHTNLHPVYMQHAYKQNENCETQPPASIG